jgi:hypothetical protein
MLVTVLITARQQAGVQSTGLHTVCHSAGHEQAKHVTIE